MDSIQTIIENASLDLKTIEDFVNLPEGSDVYPRLLPSVDVGTLSGVRQAVFEAGGLPAVPFLTKSLMTASTLLDGKYALVTNDVESNNGYYEKISGSWVKVKWQPTVGNEKLLTSTKNLFDPTTIITGSGYNNLGGIQVNASYRRTVKYPVTAGEWISLSGLDGLQSAPQSNIHFWNNDTFVTFLPLPKAPTTTTMSFQVPVGANYFTMNVNSLIVPPKLQIEKSEKSTIYEPYSIPANSISNGFKDELLFKRSTKNLYDGKMVTGKRIIATGTQDTPDVEDVISSFIPVVNGKTYTISGIEPNKINPASLRLAGYSSDAIMNLGTNFVKTFPVVWSSEITITIDDPNVKYLLLPLTSKTYSKAGDASALTIQVEEGTVATSYEPYEYQDGALKLYKAAISATSKLNSAPTKTLFTEFVEMNKVRNVPTVLQPFTKDISPFGLSYSLKGNTDSAANVLYAQVHGLEKGQKSVYANLMKYVGKVSTAGVLKGVPFTVPSGQFDNPNTLTNYDGRFSKYSYAHPDIAYDSVGVAGFKYWMIASILPPTNMNDVIWEDEDVFVSNDAKNWQRIRSLYETDKTYTTANLRLPPQSLATTNARKNAILPCPARGDVIEISVPADNGMPALDRVNITLTELPWKHDPAILIDGGYVYTYHSYHLPYADRNGGKNRFIVCVRTNDGINWDVVRTDGSTMRLTEANSRTIFTKSEDGKYNYMYYAYNRAYSNPNIIKYGVNDYELVYGLNYSKRFKGTTPYNFNFNLEYPFKDVASDNHPCLVRDGSTLYLINNEAVYSSTDRGQTLTKLPYYPMWTGGVSGIGYKKAACVGEGGKLVLVDTERYHLQAFEKPFVGNTAITSDENLMFFYEYPSLSDFIYKSNTGLVDAYIDVQICRINYETKRRELLVVPAVSLATMTNQTNRPTQRTKVADITTESGDVLFLFVTLNSRNGAEISFSGIDII